MTNQKRSFDNSMEIPFFIPLITNEDKEIIKKVLNSTLLTLGPELEKFEKKFAKFTDAKYAIGVSNATAALQLALKTLKINKDDEVLIPDLTFIATASSVLNNGGIPVLVDVEKDSLNISVESIKKKITSKTKAIIVVHFAGRACNMKEIMKIAKLNNLRVIEDCAHAIGTRFCNKHVGTFGDIGCFSFYPTKNITTIEGGMVITNSKKNFDNVKSLRNHSMTKSLSQRYSSGNPWDYDIIEPGYNFRLDEIRSALGSSQLQRIKKLNQLRRNACKYYNQHLQKVKGIKTPSISSNDSCHLYVIRITSEYGITRNQLYKKLLKNKIRTTVHYKPLHKFSIFKKYKNSKDLANSSQIYEEILSLPLYPQISQKQQDKVIKCISDQ